MIHVNIPALLDLLDKTPPEGRVAIMRDWFSQVWLSGLDFTGDCLRAGCSLDEASTANPYRTESDLKPWEQELKDRGAPLYREADIDKAYLEWTQWQKTHFGWAHFAYYQLPGRPGWVYWPR